MSVAINDLNVSIAGHRIVRGVHIDIADGERDRSVGFRQVHDRQGADGHSAVQCDDVRIDIR